ncbi:MAG TPA: MtrB/PioB family outer membrane beta-barrel protein, partial [Burkholderiales bacterium]|nr:MtrB/PioB family outer membrane beta-barrel protein [Burkholderiales bacterium]
MNIAKKHPGFSQTVIALAVLAAFGPAHAEDGDDLAQLTKPESSVSVGVGAASGGEKDRALFGQYNGLRKDSVNLLLDLDYVKRNDATGTWTTVRGRNLGLDNRELGFSMQKQGDWKFSADYNEITRHDPRTINTGMLNAGTTTPTVNLLSAPGTGSELNLELRRKGLGFGVEKWLTPSLQLEVNFKNEDKDGARLFGKGFACTSSAAPGCAAGSATATGTARLFVPEPIDSSTKQVDAKLNYSGEKLMLSGGYYGSFYNNMNGTLTPTVPGTLNNPLGTPLPLSTGLQSILQLPMALPPDNQAHQLYLSGSYAFTPKTRSTFKLAYTHATQDDNFLGSGLTGAPAGRTSLDGVLDTTLAQFGLTARPMPKLFLLANLRYEDK